MNDIISGAIVMGYLIAGLFFLRFWSRTKDTLFALFALAFGILAVQRFALGITTDRFEDQTVFYLMRLAAFVLIIVAIVLKNRSTAK